MQFRVEPIPFREAKEFVVSRHYTRGMTNGPTGTYGLYDGDTLLGVCVFSTPCAESVRSYVFGPEHKGRVTELSRLVLLDEAPRNSESYFVSRSLKLLKKAKPHLWAVVSFADQTEGHIGVIYQATNALYFGETARKRSFVTGEGRIRHRRQNGIEIARTEGENLGWKSVIRARKHRYLFLLPDCKTHRTWLLHNLKLTFEPYPKWSDDGND